MKLSVKSIPTKSGSISTSKGGWSASSAQLAAAVAAAEAYANGGKEGDAIAAAKAAYDEKKTEAPAPAPAPLDSSALDEQRQYFIAVANLGAGDFRKLSNAELLDVACLVDRNITTAEEWSALRKKVLGK